MKRTLVFIIASLICVSIKAQDFPKNINGELEFVEVIETKLSKTMLYSNAKEWIAKTFGDYKSVIQFEDNENGKLIIKGISNVNYIGSTSLTETKEQISYTLTIETKKGKYRYKLDNIFINQSVNVMGSIVYPKPFIPLEHLNLIEKYSHVLDSIKFLAAELSRYYLKTFFYRSRAAGN